MTSTEQAEAGVEEEQEAAAPVEVAETGGDDDAGSESSPEQDDPEYDLDSHTGGPAPSEPAVSQSASSRMRPAASANSGFSEFAASRDFRFFVSEPDGAIRKLSMALKECELQVWEKAARWMPENKAPARLAEWMATQGYSIEDGQQWRITPGLEGDNKEPSLGFSLTQSVDKAEHQWYIVVCSITRREPVSASWVAPRRLTHLRDGLHHYVKKSLGQEAYKEAFSNTPFAKSGGFFWGTQQRLTAWLEALAVCINSGKASPDLVGYVLEFFTVPPLAVDQTSSI
mmetsp:Transcript_25646/g.59759  ORF Transcript_25646/g.59759 Transcript_25646/m.59759 type:complete len:285 (+) Transcript_25646:36-890(+)